MKVNAQFAALRTGALDMTLLPLPYAGGEVPELNVSFIPGLVTSYEQGYAWKKAEIGRALTRFLADKGVVLLTWIWQAGGAASRAAPESAASPAGLAFGAARHRGKLLA